eukprot:scaffold29635_cov124-Skeletonema_marinoi.AAC.2
MVGAQKSSSPAPGDYRTFVTGNEHCFTLPFLLTNPSQLLACGMHSTEIIVMVMAIISGIPFVTLSGEIPLSSMVWMSERYCQKRG